VTRLSAIEELAGMDMLCSDKTGTLTLNKMVIQEDCPVYCEGEDRESVLFQAALAAKWKEPPRDALDTMILVTSGQDLELCNVFTQTDFVPFDPRTKRTEGTLRGPTGAVFRITKGAPHIILNLCRNADKIRDAVDAKVLELGKRGIRSLAVARLDSDKEGWRMLGILTFLDPPRPDTKVTLQECGRFGVHVKMITGDHLVIAKETSRQLGLGTNIQGTQGLPVLATDGTVPDDLVQQYGNLIIPPDGFAQVFPEHKYLIVQTLRQAGFRVGMTGDGVNDAPALKRSDVGIAVQGATDAARAAADIVLTNEGLSVVVEAIKQSREIFARLQNFILYRIAATLQLLSFFFIAVFALRPVDFYNRNFCPGIFWANASTACYNITPPILAASLYNAPSFAQGSDPIYFQPTPRTCARNQLDCVYNPSLFTIKDGLFLSSSEGNTTMDPSLCMTDDDGECIGAAAPWPDFFQLPVLMLMLITLLNDGTLISIGYDFVKPSKYPERWNFLALFCIATVLGAVACASSLLLLWAALDSNNPAGLFAGIGIPPIEYGKIVTSIFLKVSLSDFLTLFSARTQGDFFWSVLPSPVLLTAAGISLIISTILACVWPAGTLDRLPVMGLALGEYKLLPLWIWLYCILCWLIQDALKVLSIFLIENSGIFSMHNAHLDILEASKKLAADAEPEGDDRV